MAAGKWHLVSSAKGMAPVNGAAASRPANGHGLDAHGRPSTAPGWDNRSNTPAGPQAEAEAEPDQTWVRR